MVMIEYRNKVNELTNQNIMLNAYIRQLEEHIKELSTNSNEEN